MVGVECCVVLLMIVGGVKNVPWSKISCLVNPLSSPCSWTSITRTLSQLYLDHSEAMLTVHGLSRLSLASCRHRNSPEAFVGVVGTGGVFLPQTASHEKHSVHVQLPGAVSLFETTTRLPTVAHSRKTADRKRCQLESNSSRLCTGASCCHTVGGLGLDKSNLIPSKISKVRSNASACTLSQKCRFKYRYHLRQPSRRCSG